MKNTFNGFTVGGRKTSFDKTVLPHTSRMSFGSYSNDNTVIDILAGMTQDKPYLISTSGYSPVTTTITAYNNYLKLYAAYGGTTVVGFGVTWCIRDKMYVVPAKQRYLYYKANVVAMDCWNNLGIYLVDENNTLLTIDVQTSGAIYPGWVSNAVEWVIDLWQVPGINIGKAYKLGAGVTTGYTSSAARDAYVEFLSLKTMRYLPKIPISTGTVLNGATGYQTFIAVYTGSRSHYVNNALCWTTYDDSNAATSWYNYITIRTDHYINFSSFNKFVIKAEVYNASGRLDILISASTTLNSGGAAPYPDGVVASTYVNAGGVGNIQTIELDVSALNGYYYLYFIHNPTSPGGLICNVYESYFI